MKRTFQTALTAAILIVAPAPAQTVGRSADDGLIALSLRDQSGKLQIFTINPDGTDRRQLTFEGDNGRPDWSPDGRRIVFNTLRQGKIWVAVMDAGGSNQKLLTEGHAPDWSPDGTQIAFGKCVPNGCEIWLIGADGSGQRQVTRSGSFKAAPSWSPDGKQMAFILVKNPASWADHQPEIGIMNSDGTNERILTTSDRTNIRANSDGSTAVCETANDANAPAWSPVDDRIAFWSGIENAYGQIWVIRADGAGSRQLTEDCNHRNSDDPSWSPDGGKILFSTGRSGRNELWVMDADGSNEKRVSDIDAVPFPGRAAWQPVQRGSQNSREWGPDTRLTFDSANSRLTVNFARSMAVDGDGRVHAVWFDDRSGASRIFHRRSARGGADWEPEQPLSNFPSSQEMPAIAASGSNVYVVWQDNRDKGLNIHFKRSEDSGLGWSPDVRLSDGGSGAYASLAVSGSNVYVVWGDNRDGQAEIYVRASNDGGATWGPETRISDTPWDSWVPTIAAEGDNVYVGWVDTQDGNEEEYFCRSTDRGVTWEPVQPLTSDRANSWAPTLAAAGNRVHLVWFDQKDSSFQPFEAENKLNEAMDLLGLKYEPAAMGVVVPNPEELAKRRATEKLELIMNAAPAWVAGGGDTEKLRTILDAFDALGPRGAPYIVKEIKLDEAVALMDLTYSSRPLVAQTPKVDQPQARAMRIRAKLWRIQETGPQWVAHGGDLTMLQGVLVEFQRMYELATTEWEIYYLRSNDHGATWESTTRLTTAPGTSQRPSIALAGNRLFITWFDNRDGNNEVYFKESANGGDSWGPDVRLTAAPGESVFPTIAVRNGLVHVVWSDTRDGNPEIYYKRSR